MKVGTRTPWGQADHVSALADGIWVVSTPGHGGVKVDRSRNAGIHPAWRKAGGWYEEDIEALIVLITFADELNKEDKLQDFLEEARNWMPDAYEKVFDVVVTEEQSYIRRRDNFNKANAENFVVVSASGSWHETVPEGKVGVIGRRRSDGIEKSVLVDAEKYETRNSFGYVLEGDEPEWNR